MPAQAGIQSVGDNNNFKNLDSRFRGNDGVFPNPTRSLVGEVALHHVGCRTKP